MSSDATQFRRAPGRSLQPADELGQVSTRPDTTERTLRTCPNCGAELHERKCKLFCPRPGCGYYLSCTDYL